MKTRIYLVTPVKGNLKPRLVKATSVYQALSHVARSIIECGVATQDELVDCLTKGVVVEEANAESDDGSAT